MTSTLQLSDQESSESDSGSAKEVRIYKLPFLVRDQNEIQEQVCKIKIQIEKLEALLEE